MCAHFEKKNMKKIIMIKDKRKRVVSNDSKLPCSGLYLLIMAVWYKCVAGG